ncbi:MAG: heparinase II/III family protein [Pseudomonadota bacterium]
MARHILVSRPAIPLSRMVQLAALAAGQEIASARARFNRRLPALALVRRKPDRLEVAPPDLRPPIEQIGEGILAGDYSFCGTLVQAHGESPFDLPDVPDAWQEALHGFGWLRHLRACETELARANGRGLVADWIAQSPQLKRLAWDGHVVARRLISWLGHAPMILDGVDEAFYDRFLRSLAEQAHALEAAHGGARPGVGQLQSSIALAMYALCVPARRGRRARAGHRLARDLKAQILPDGGHISRNPVTVINLLLDLLPLRQTYIATNETPPSVLIEMIERMMPMLRFFRHGDGALAQFNGMGGTDPDIIAALLTYDEARGVPIRHARHSGYHRLAAAGATVLVDAGKPPPLRHASQAHASAASFEFSSALGRYVVNCGAGTRPGDQWAVPCRMTAAHSTVSIGDRSSAVFARYPWVEDRLGILLASGPGSVTSDRTQTAGDHDLAISHDGYGPAYSLRHHRRIVLSQDGLRLDGEDWFEPIGRRSNETAEARFHLHPDVSVAVGQEGFSYLLQRVDASGNPELWELVADGGELSLEDSVFVAGPEPARQTKQIVLSGKTGADSRMAWSFIRRSTS